MELCSLLVFYVGQLSKVLAHSAKNENQAQLLESKVNFFHFRGILWSENVRL